MIRINLLPFRLARKKENIRRQVSIFSLSVVLISLAMTWYAMRMDNQIQRIQEETAQVQSQIALYKERAERVTAIKKKLKTLEEKLAIVASLQTRRNEQQILLEEMADRIVKERMWLESLSANAQTVTVKGVAFDNPTIADFMRNLEACPLFSNVDLRRSVSRSFSQNVVLKSFELVCTKRAEKKAEPAKNGGKKHG